MKTISQFAAERGLTKLEEKHMRQFFDKKAKTGEIVRIRNRNGIFEYLDSDLDSFFPPSESRAQQIVDFCATAADKPKYDPCRKLKIGDVVRVLKINGNLPKCKWAGNTPKEGVTGIVRELRKEDHFVWIDCKEIVGYCIDPAYLELVTPVEKLEPYYVKETASVYEVFNRNENNGSVAIFFKSQYSIEKAKARAEAERDRLNAEYRKEQE